MVLRTESVKVRLLKLEEVVSHLEELRQAPSDKAETDFRTTWAVERGLQLGAEALLDVGNHLLSAHFGVAAEDYEDVIRQLGERGVVTRELAARLRGLGGFRNLLVHGYLRLDPQRVRDHLDRGPGDFTAFTAAVRGWLEEQGYS